MQASRSAKPRTKAAGRTRRSAARRVPAKRRTAKPSAAAGTSSATPVRAQLAQRLRALITDGTYKPGDRMIERELCERLKVSRPSVREALRQLEAEELVAILPNRGPVVRTITEADALDLWEVRIALETLIARRFVEHGSSEQIARLERSIRNLERALHSRKSVLIKTSRSEFFEAFAAGGNNAVLADYFRKVNRRFSFLWSSALMFPGRPAESIHELYALLASIKNRNADASGAAIVLYNEHAKTVGMHGLRLFNKLKSGPHKATANTIARSDDGHGTEHRYQNPAHDNGAEDAGARFRLRSSGPGRRRVSEAGTRHHP